MTYEESLRNNLDWCRAEACTNATDRWIMRAQYLLDRAVKWPKYKRLTADSTTIDRDVLDAFALSTSDAGGCRCKDTHDDPTADNCLISVIGAAYSASISMHTSAGDALADIIWGTLDSDIWAAHAIGYPHTIFWFPKKKYLDTTG